MGRTRAPLFCHLDYLGGGPIYARGACEFEMLDDAEAAKRYRTRAKEVRAIAEAVADRRSRMTLLRVAADYERMARLRIRVGKADRAMGSATLELPQTE